MSEAPDAQETPATVIDSPDPGPRLIAQVGAEAFGAFLLVFAGVGTALWAGIAGVGGGPLAVALAFGLAVMAAAAVVGHVSGGHFNPAVTLGAAVAGRIPWRDVLPYWLAQVIGGSLAAAVLFIITASLGVLDGNERTYFSQVSTGFAENSPIAAQAGTSLGFGVFGAFVAEMVVTAVLVIVALGVTSDRAPSPRLAPVVIGLTLTTMILVALPITNASVNPARSTATALFSEPWALEQLWLFWGGPLMGAAIAGAVGYVVFAPRSVASLGMFSVEELDAAERSGSDEESPGQEIAGDDSPYERLGSSSDGPTGEEATTDDEEATSKETVTDDDGQTSHDDSTDDARTGSGPVRTPGTPEV